MSVMLSRPVTVEDQEFAVEVSDLGDFIAEFQGERLVRDRLSTLRDALLARVRKDQLAAFTPVPVLMVQRNASQQRQVLAQVVKIHAGTGNPILQWPDGKREQITGWGYSGGWLSCAPETPADEVSAYLGRIAQRADLDKVIRSFEDTHSISKLGEYVRQRQAAALAAPKAS